MSTLPALRPFVLGVLVLGAAGCVSRPVDAPPKSVVFFTPFSAELDGPAMAAVDQVVQDAKAAPTRTVLVEGYADRVGTPEANRILSQNRAQAVANALVQRGVSQNRIVLRPRGPTDTEPGIESRRVEVEFGK